MALKAQKKAARVAKAVVKSADEAARAVVRKAKAEAKVAKEKLQAQAAAQKEAEKVLKAQKVAAAALHGGAEAAQGGGAGVKRKRAEAVAEPFGPQKRKR